MLTKLEETKLRSRAYDNWEEIDLRRKVKSLLENPKLSQEEWQKLQELTSFFTDKSELQKLLFARAPSEEEANSVLNDIDLEHRDYANKNRTIWLKISELETKVYLGDRGDATSNWNKLSSFFYSLNPAKKTGLLLKKQYWREAFNGGLADSTDAFFGIWIQSNTSYPFKDWCDYIGVSIYLKYLDEKERENLRIKIIDNKLYDMANQLIDTKLTDCVMSLDEVFYCFATSLFNSEGHFLHHSSITSGQPVLFAGEIAVANGILTKITTRSGHYCPGDRDLYNFLLVLEEKGMNLEKVAVENDDERLLAASAKTFMEEYKDSMEQMSNVFARR